MIPRTRLSKVSSKPWPEPAGKNVGERAGRVGRVSFRGNGRNLTSSTSPHNQQGTPMKHTKTDPACREYRGHRTPRNPITRYLDRRARGKSCGVCMPGSWIRARWNDLPADALYCNPRANLHLNCEHVDKIEDTK